MRKEKELRTEEWTRQTLGIGKLHKSQPLPIDEGHEVEAEGVKSDSKSNVTGKILKPNRPKPQPEEILSVIPKPSTKLKKLEGKNEKACCVIA